MPQDLLTRLNRAATASGLLPMGAQHPHRTGSKALDHGTLVLFGTGPGFWPAFQTSAEFNDAAPDPVDRWSRRIIGTLADQFGATAHFPFGGPPYAPFIDWAQKSGQAHPSPVGMLVHARVGLMISYRGALHFAKALPIADTAAASPCLSCDAQPCTTACPVNALSGSASYDVAACHAYLDTAAGRDCLRNGCAARRACPVSAGAARNPAQSALHMKAFHPS
ncbi:ferredoxin [Rhodobacteraceae bacterium F11138]|nr:ferredoxin [Rhodobacteraceae bacterium F11138]